jgi:hypothetical protein
MTAIATIPTSLSVVCSTCGARLARDNDDDVCSPCRRSSIESAARRAGLIVRDAPGARLAFNSAGLEGVAAHLRCTRGEALDVLFSLGLLPLTSHRRRPLLRRLIDMESDSHVAAADALGISRWTVASYRRQLGIDTRHHQPGARVR